MESNKDALREFLRGAAFTVLVMGGFVGVLLVVGMPSEKVSKERFRVVTNYAGCAVVEFSPPNRAQSVFFLDCQHYRD